MLKTILSISGKPGLYKLISQGKNMLIVESISADKKRFPAYGNEKIISLADIAMYTDDAEVPLYDVLEAMKKKENTAVTSIDPKKATPEQIEELEEIVYLTEFHVSKGHSSQVFELDNKFHETLYQASGSKVLAGVLTDFHNYVQRVRKMTLKSKERSEKSNDEHRMIAQAIHDHDPEKAQMLANQHIMRTIENIDHCGWDNLLQESRKENENSGN